MGTLTIRKLDDDVKERLRVRAALAGRSMEEEARAILSSAVSGASRPALLDRAKTMFDPAHGVDFETSPREAGRLAPNLKK